MKKPLGEKMEFFRQYDEVLFKQLEKKILDLETANQQFKILAKEYRLQFKNVSDVVFMIGADFKILSISPSMEKLSGYKAEDFIGRHAYDFRHIFTPESFERGIANINKMLKGKRIPATTYEVVTKDGTLKHVEIHGSPLMRYGKVAGTISVARDITERKLMEEKLLRKEQRFRALIEHSSDIIVIINLEGTIIYINPAVKEVLGFKPEERLGARGFELVHPYDMKLIAEAFNILSKDKNSPVIKGELRLRHKDGGWRIVEAVGSNLVNNNVIEAVIVNYRDITERKTDEEKLKESEEKYRKLVEKSLTGIGISKGNKVIFANPALLHIFGYDTLQEFIKIPLLDHVAPYSREMITALSIKRKQGKESETNFEYDILRKDGEIRTLHGYATHFIWGDELYTQTTFEDITERKRAEEILRKSEQRYRELSIIDDLTHLYNSRHFYAQLEIEIERYKRYGQPFTLLLLDIDKFKKFNDKYGHVEGDYVLSQLGQVIKRCLRDPDSAYRYGGEEFAIMLPMTTGSDGIVTAQRIQTELRKETFSAASDKKIKMTVSIGLAQYKPKEKMKMFVQRVDKLMYKAKKEGRDRICSDRSIYKRSFIGAI